jgi:hypothetical protein
MLRELLRMLLRRVAASFEEPPEIEATLNPSKTVR